MLGNEFLGTDLVSKYAYLLMSHICCNIYINTIFYFYFYTQAFHCYVAKRFMLLHKLTQFMEIPKFKCRQEYVFNENPPPL